MTITVVLNAGAPPDHLYVLEVAEAASEAIRVLNLQTRHHEALASPEDVDVVLSALATMTHRLPQLLDQLAGRLEAEAKAGRLEVALATPGLAVNAVRMSLDYTKDRFREAEESLEAAHQVTAALAPAGSEGAS